MGSHSRVLSVRTKTLVQKSRHLASIRCFRHITNYSKSNNLLKELSKIYFFQHPAKTIYILFLQILSNLIFFTLFLPHMYGCFGCVDVCVSRVHYQAFLRVLSKAISMAVLLKIYLF